ncbi:MAG: ADP-heptose--LPS heptosyltransferase [Pelagibacteraceae bacterium TMED287]|nr:MAG: ADP-heptose--LPS heptosyltransferase [Pelagibacteraceae bacterium TMED287]|tara:strand:+ start:1050 stop:1976 length:927 start_codon:yes stop_codon:yes gene_type:complete
MVKKILLYNSGGGLGDSIQLFSLILSLQKHFQEYELNYLGAHDNHFVGKLKEYNIKIQNFNIDIKYFGFRWWHLFITKKQVLKSKIDNFYLIIDLQSKFRNTIILKQIPHQNFYSSTFNYYFCSKPELKTLINKDLNLVNYDLNKIPKKYFDESLRLLPDNNYIGFSLTQGNVYREKSWPVKNFITVAKKILASGKKVVFFVEKSNLKIINDIKKDLPEAIFPEHNSELACPALVTALATRLEKAVTIDNGVMHMIGLADIPLIVLFGPTNSSKFAPKIKNIKIIDSKILYNSTNISKISSEDVLKYI